VPKSEISTPDNAGPVLRAILNTTAFRPIAFVRFFAAPSRRSSPRAKLEKNLHARHQKRRHVNMPRSDQPVENQRGGYAYRKPLANCALTT